MAKRKLAGAALAARNAKLARQASASVFTAQPRMQRVGSCSQAGSLLRKAKGAQKSRGGYALRKMCGGGMKKGFKYTKEIREAIAARNRRRKDRHEKRFAGVARIARALALD